MIRVHILSGITSCASCPELEAEAAVIIIGGCPLAMRFESRDDAEDFVEWVGDDIADYRFGTRAQDYAFSGWEKERNWGNCPNYADPDDPCRQRRHPDKTHCQSCLDDEAFTRTHGKPVTCITARG